MAFEKLRTIVITAIPIKTLSPFFIDLPEHHSWSAELPQFLQHAMRVAQQSCGADGVEVKLAPVRHIDVEFALISFDKKVCNSVPLLSHLFEEVSSVTNPLDKSCIQPKTDEFLRIDLWICRHLVIDASPFAFLSNPSTNAISSFVHLPRAQKAIERARRRQRLTV